MFESLFNFGKKWKTLMNFANKKRAFINQHKQVLFTIQFYLLWTYCLWTSTWVMSKHVFEFLQISCCSIVPLAHWWVKKNTIFFIDAKTVEYKIGWMKNNKCCMNCRILIVAVGAAVIIIVYGHYHLNDYRQILWPIFSIHNLKLLYAFINLLNFHTSNQIDD